MVKILRLLCIAGIILLLGLFVGYTEFGNGNKKKEISENQQELAPEKISIEVEQNKSDTNINFSQKIIKLAFF